LTSGRLVLTAECLPPRHGGPDAVRQLSAALPPLLDAVVVADNPDGIHGSALACAALLAREGRDTVLSMVTRDRNRIALESDVRGAASLGIGGILCLSGNHQSLGVCPQAAGVYDIDSIQFTQMLKGWSFDGLLVGAVAHPYQQPLELNLLRLKKKVAAGADFLLTEAVLDLAGFTRWMDAVREMGVNNKTAIIATVLPLASVEKAEVLRRRQTSGPLDEAVLTRLAKASDPAVEGVAMAGAMAAQLKTIPGVRGIHILSGGCESLAARVIEAAGLA
jgi:methylenetetrahydrofolate reductase (NADPH)